MQLSSTDVPVGRAVAVTVGGVPPGTGVSLEGYTRPSTTYRQLRAATPAGSDGTVHFTLQPTTNSRIRPQLAGCSSPGSSQVVTVHAGLSLRITRTGTRQYTFGGSILPATPNIGRQVTLFYRTSTGTAVRRAVAAVRSDGTYEARVRFAGSALLTFFWQTGNNLVNAAATSAGRSVLVS
jgi:hypothetical protein